MSRGFQIATDFASAGWVEYIGGLKSGNLSIEFHDDVADNDVDEELWALLGTVVAVENYVAGDVIELFVVHGF